MQPARVASQPPVPAAPVVPPPLAAAARSAINALVITPDARFHERTRSVLDEISTVSGAFLSPADPGDVQWLVGEAGADVVVLDATDCEAAVARVVAELAASAPRLGVVIVCEHLTHAARDLDALPKWGWTRALRVAVQQAHIDGSPLAPARQRLRDVRRDLRGVGPSAIARR